MTKHYFYYYYYHRHHYHFQHSLLHSNLAGSTTVRVSLFCPKLSNYAACINPFQTIFSANRILPSSYLFWAVRGWWITCNYPTVLKEENMEI
jgi:hypothetical protein